MMLVFITCASRLEAERIARAAVKEKLAACGSVVPGVQSFFVWKNKLERAREVLLVLKTTEKRFAALEKRVRTLHAYDVPEILGVRVEKASRAYAAWVRAGCA